MIYLINNVFINAIIFMIELMVSMISLIGLYDSRSINDYDNIRLIILLISICDIIYMFTIILLSHKVNRFLLIINNINFMINIVFYIIYQYLYFDKLSKSDKDDINKNYNILYMIINMRLFFFYILTSIFLVYNIYHTFKYIKLKINENNENNRNNNDYTLLINEVVTV